MSRTPTTDKNIKSILMSRRYVTVDNCWLYTGGKHTGGHGKIQLNFREQLAHRVAAHIFLGLDLDAPFRIEVKHKCTNLTCFNPKHLFLVVKNKEKKNGKVHRDNS